MTYAIVAVLLHLSIFLIRTSTKKHISLLSYFFTRYSVGDVYSIVDLSNQFSFYCFKIFSASFIRLQKEKSETGHFNFSYFLKKIRGEDFGYFMVAFIISVVAEYGLFKLYDISTKISGGPLCIEQDQRSHSPSDQVKG